MKIAPTSEKIINPRAYLLRGFALFFVLGASAYIFFEFRNLLTGPTLQISYPKNGAPVEEPLIIVGGQAENVSYIYINGRQIFVDDQGRFAERLLLAPGYNIITAKAVDRFGKEKEYGLELVYKKPPDEIATSSTPVTE